MSSQKVEQYKDEKRNRKSTLKKEKRQRIIARILMVFCAVVLLGWLGWSAFTYFTKDSQGTDAENVHISVLDDYLDSLEKVEATP